VETQSGFLMWRIGMIDKWIQRRSGWETSSNDARNPWETDYGRIIHSSSFRRLQGKTQILNLGDSDFYRTRLTHSLEVGQIARGLTQQLRVNSSVDKIEDILPDPMMIQAVGSTHDLGHPPFGHGGEVALNYCMRNNGGFEGNGQTLRILSRLEKMSANEGSDLTRRSLLAVLKYPVSYSTVANPSIIPQLENKPTSIRLINRKLSKPPKCYHDTEQDVVEWVLKGISKSDIQNFTSFKEIANKHGKANYKSFDCSIMDLADDIAYGVHDLEDMIAMRLVTREDFEKYVSESHCRSFLEASTAKYKAEIKNDSYRWLLDGLFSDASLRKRFISRLVGHFVTSVQVKKLGVFEEPLLDHKAQLPNLHAEFLKALTEIVYNKVIKSPEVQHLEFKGQKMVVSVFEAYATDPMSLLPEYCRYEYKKSNDDVRIICDHISGMTDQYLLKTYDRLFSPRMGSVFDRL